ncbi:MAG: NAD(P)H-hydrate dehydratase [Gemmatimonadales bacterium]
MKLAAPPRPIVADATGASAADSAAIAAGVPSRALMQRAGAAAAAEIVHRYPGRARHGVVVATGSGNNGGDGWVVAAALLAAGVPVRVVECAESGTPDARAERESASAAGVESVPARSLADAGEPLIVDALLGTGFSADTPLRGTIADAVNELQECAARGAILVALDLPSGLDATSGRSAGGLRAALTLTFGTFKRGHLVGREQCGAIVLLDIGLGAHVEAARGIPLADPAWFRRSLPAIAADANKGTRGRIAVVGGSAGMAGAAILAARAALRSGAGLVKCVVAPESVPAVQEAVPEALAAAWPIDDASARSVVGDWADAMLVGPGLGRHEARELVERLLRSSRSPVVLDADALNAFAGDAAALAPLLGGRAAILTPHPAEFARLVGGGASVEDVLADRFAWPSRVAAQVKASVLLKGVPTIVASPTGGAILVAEGTPILATGGAGDLLGGIVATLLAQTSDASLAGALAAFAHGRAAAGASARAVRGYTLDDVLLELRDVWQLAPPSPRPPVLAELPAVGEP